LKWLDRDQFDSLDSMSKSNFSLFCHLQGIVYLNAKIAHGTFQLGVPK